MMRKTRAKRKTEVLEEGRGSHTRAGNTKGSERETRGRTVDQATEGAGWRERNREGRGLMFHSINSATLTSVIEDQNRS